MKTWVKVLLIILAVIVILLVAVGIFAYKTYTQVKGLASLQGSGNNEQFAADARALAAGDCSKLSAVESQMNDMKQKLKDACSNLVLKAQIDKQMQQKAGGQFNGSICDEINNPNSQLFAQYNQLKIKCVNFSDNLTNCAKEGEKFSFVYKDYPEKCCEGLTASNSGMDTKISVADICYDTNRESGNPIGICIKCGNSICDINENPCNCPSDCVGKGKSNFNVTADFCKSDTHLAICNDVYRDSLQLCKLCI